MPRSNHCLPGWRRVATLLCGALVLSGAQAQSTLPQKLRIVGGLAGVNQYTRHEAPFWTKDLSRLSGGKFDADIVPFDRAGVPGGDMLRLMQLGVVPFGTAILGTLSAQFPEYGAPDLAGLNPDMASLKKSVAAFRPYLETTLRERHGVEVLAIYVYPAQVVFCKKPLASLADLAGRRIRVSSATQSDFVGALGGVPVLTGFAQIMANMASGNTECAITGSMSGNTLGLQEVSTHIHALPVTWGLALFGANLAAWGALPPDLKILLRRELPLLEAAIWTESERETADGMACNTGASSCSSGRLGRMRQVSISAQDERRRQAIFSATVLPHWLQRCNAHCAAVWNQTIGPVRGVMAPVAQ
ncbi:TRAP transporter substrate-binding protein [Rhodoferax sp. UBA5149]|uniref:TRAP transporter substrate-binding protein n=1 Tax=Rhodoferax sp. UBA5149 TaxID=1947379 RepID=UPI0025F6B496|nr:TRAP transporter substrate-binding protein [Rhodoferax sp. UBA5149]